MANAEMKDMLTAERERNSFACKCLNVPMVLKTSYKVNTDALRALGKLIGSKVSAHWDAERAAEVKTLQSRFITDNIHIRRYPKVDKSCYIFCHLLVVAHIL
eukprot:SAG25_NODE_1000_length_4352_cov_31.202680_1_plen_102_part_00